ncbi:MAG: hypothetical protein ACOC5U_01675 [Candidatus Aminicenantaceae bacterium]
MKSMSSGIAKPWEISRRVKCPSVIKLKNNRKKQKNLEPPEKRKDNKQSARFHSRR